MHLSLSQAAALARRTPQALRYAIARGDLPAQKVGTYWLIKSTDLDKWLNNPAMHKPGKKGR